eukprot:TRINITY_DN11119_c0_g3_i3.p1 TRINITY_DN11119_c0_g3~~TRINITY_DN11119_c0_g3_i3.p1  ORF type:complete len:299 (+),score=18.90 TRINITY_DN11119_c0_g3_i3:563-1459(+)
MGRATSHLVASFRAVQSHRGGRLSSLASAVLTALDLDAAFVVRVPGGMSHSLAAIIQRFGVPPIAPDLAPVRFEHRGTQSAPAAADVGTQVPQCQLRTVGLQVRGLGVDVAVACSGRDVQTQRSVVSIVASQTVAAALSPVAPHVARVPAEPRPVASAAAPSGGHRRAGHIPAPSVASGSSSGCSRFTYNLRFSIRRPSTFCCPCVHWALGFYVGWLVSSCSVISASIMGLSLAGTPTNGLPFSMDSMIGRRMRSSHTCGDERRLASSLSTIRVVTLDDIFDVHFRFRQLRPDLPEMR